MCGPLSMICLNLMNHRVRCSNLWAFSGPFQTLPSNRPNRSRLAPPDRVMGNLRFMGIPNWLAFAVIGLVFILMMKNAYS